MEAFHLVTTEVISLIEMITLRISIISKKVALFDQRQLPQLIPVHWLIEHSSEIENSSCCNYLNDSKDQLVICNVGDGNAELYEYII